MLPKLVSCVKIPVASSSTGAGAGCSPASNRGMDGVFVSYHCVNHLPSLLLFFSIHSIRFDIETQSNDDEDDDDSFPVGFLFFPRVPGRSLEEISTVMVVGWVAELVKVANQFRSQLIPSLGSL